MKARAVVSSQWKAVADQTTYVRASLTFKGRKALADAPAAPVAGAGETTLWVAGETLPEKGEARGGTIEVATGGAREVVRGTAGAVVEAGVVAELLAAGGAAGAEALGVLAAGGGGADMAVA